MKRIVLLPLLLLLISAWLPFHSVNADERKVIANGVYQVELSFLSHEVTDADVLFTKQATLTVKEGRYTLAIPAKNDHILTKVSAAQQGKKLNTWLGRAENLVQFDIKDVQKKVELTGTYRLAQEKVQQSFSQDLKIETHSLPKFEAVQPVAIIKAGDDTIVYQLLTDGKKSSMSDFVNPLIRIVKKDQRLYAQMEILQPQQVTGFTVEQDGALVEPKVVSNRKTRIVQFEVEDFKQGTNIWMKVESPEKSYVKEELTHIAFDLQQAAKFASKEQSDNGAVSSLTKRTEKPVKSVKPVNETTVVEKEAKEKVPSEVTNPKPVETLPALTEEEQLAFDRTVDAKKEEQAVAQVASEPTELAADESSGQGVPFDIVKIGVLLSLCILSGILLIRRLTKKNNVTTNE